MIPIFIASNVGYTGKTFITLGIALELMGQGFTVGYIKPFGKMPIKRGDSIFDEDGIFMKEALGLPEPLSVISPFVLTHEEQLLDLVEKAGDARKQIMTAFQTLKGKDFVVVGGSTDLLEGAMLNIDGVSLIEEMNAQVLVVEAWRGILSIDSLVSAQRLLGKRFIGGVLNKVPEEAVSYVRETVRPFLEKSGVRMFGIFQKDKVLESITIRRIIEVVNGGILCGEDKLDDLVEKFMIGAMDVDNALKYFSKIPNKAVITGAHRTDIQLAAMETPTKCIILTGGLYTNEVVLEKARAKGIPIIWVPDDTFTTVDKIEAVKSGTRIREKGKISRTKELFEKEFDIKRFLKVVKEGE